MSTVPTASAEAVILDPCDPCKERRQRERLKLRLSAHIRPVYCEDERLEEVTNTLDFNRNGLCFSTWSGHYYVGLILFVTLPYSLAAPVWKKYLAEVVRIDYLPNGSQAVALRFLS